MYRYGLCSYGLHSYGRTGAAVACTGILCMKGKLSSEAVKRSVGTPIPVHRTRRRRYRLPHADAMAESWTELAASYIAHSAWPSFPKQLAIFPIVVPISYA